MYDVLLEDFLRCQWCESFPCECCLSCGLDERWCECEEEDEADHFVGVNKMEGIE